MIKHRIPEEIKQDVIDVVRFVETRLPFIAPNKQVYLFEIYNQYVNPIYMDDLKCSCVNDNSTVIGKLRRIVNEWKAQETNS